MTPPITDEAIAATVVARAATRSNVDAAKALGVDEKTVRRHMALAAERGLLGFAPVLDGFAVSQVSSKVDGHWVKQRKAAGEIHEIPEGFALKRDSAFTDAEGRRIAGWRISEPSKEHQLAVMRATVDALKEELPRVEPVRAPDYTIGTLLNQYTITDVHLGALAWAEETGQEDYDLAIGEKLVDDWFASAIDLAPPAETAIFAQMGDWQHWDGFESVTPTSKHILDGDSRFPKMVRTSIRLLRRTTARLLTKHKHVHIIMCDANHDPASEVWLREMFAAFYEDEPRVTVDRSSGTYYAYQHGNVSLFYHHGHRRKIGNVDSVFAGRYREIYGNTKHSYAHLGHLHSDELKSTNLMKVERHETLAAPDAYAANGGWLSGRSAKVITYHKDFGEVARLTLTPGMVKDAAKQVAANDNEPMRSAA